MNSREQQSTPSVAESTLETLPLHSTDLLTLLDEQGVIHYESPAIERLYGYEQDELVGEPVADYFHPDDRQRVMDAFVAVVEGEAHHTEAVEYRHLMADDSYRWIESVASSNPTPEGLYVVNSRDISERKERERELAAARQQAAAERDRTDAIRQLLLAASTDRDIEGSVCRLLVEEYDCAAAWITRQYDVAISGDSDTLTLAAHGDDRGFRSESTNEVDAVTRRALSTQESTAVERDGSETVREEAADKLAACGLAAARSVPLEHDGLSFGVLTVVSDAPLGEGAADLLSEFADAVAFTQRLRVQQQTLAAQRVLELRVEITDWQFLLGIASAPELPDDVRLVGHELSRGKAVTYLVETTDISADRLAAAAEGVAGVRDVAAVSQSIGSKSLVRLRVDAPTVGTVLTGYGGAVETMVAAEGRLTVTAQFSQLTDLGTVARSLRAEWPEAVVTASASRPVDEESPAPFGELTIKQEAALRAATVAGFFDRPQGATASEIADSLDVSRSTFLHHVRAAERKIFGDVFEVAPDDERYNNPLAADATEPDEDGVESDDAVDESAADAGAR